MEALKEEQFDGYVIIDCPRCGKNKVYFKEGEKTILCPACMEKKNIKILKRINKKVSGYRRYYSVDTEKNFFNY